MPAGHGSVEFLRVDGPPGEGDPARGGRQAQGALGGGPFWPQVLGGGDFLFLGFLFFLGFYFLFLGCPLPGPLLDASSRVGGIIRTENKDNIITIIYTIMKNAK